MSAVFSPEAVPVYLLFSLLCLQKMSFFLCWFSFGFSYLMIPAAAAGSWDTSEALISAVKRLNLFQLLHHCWSNSPEAVATFNNTYDSYFQGFLMMQQRELFCLRVYQHHHLIPMRSRCSFWHLTWNKIMLGIIILLGLNRWDWKKKVSSDYFWSLLRKISPSNEL